MQDFHSHLYGCLSPKMAQSLCLQDPAKVLASAKAAAPWDPSQTRWSWFESRYLAEFSRLPSVNLEDINSSKLDEQQITDTLMHRGPAKFSAFQARFNLLIALFPLSVWQDKVLKECFQAQIREKVSHREYRVFLDFSQKGWEQVFLTAKKINLDHAPEFSCSLVVSMPHEQEAYIRAFDCLDHYFAATPSALSVFAGVDFCMFEERYQPSAKKQMLTATRRFSSHPRKIPLLMHVGETIETISLKDSLQRIHATIDVGATRIGHGCSLVRNPGSPEDKELQAKVEEKVKSKKVLVESCPTSNSLIAGIDKPCAAEFQSKGIPYLICSDDPGILGTTLQSEHAEVKAALGKDKVREANYPEKFPFA